uniref:Small cell adhesion glycoprotein n=1 Tax=Castor canadensis TaxID=51338 RepID=A0A8C0ZPE0_CASCN
ITLTIPFPGEELMKVTDTALIAVVVTVVFLTLLWVMILIFFYKRKGSYMNYEPVEGKTRTIRQMDSDSVKGREKEEYFI